VIEFFLAVNIIDQVACVCGDVCMGGSSMLSCEKHFKDGNVENTAVPCSFWPRTVSVECSKQKVDVLIKYD